MRSIWNWIRCNLIGDHDWTSAAQEGIQMEDLPLVKRLIETKQHHVAFNIYSRMYCKRCRKESGYNRR